MGPSYAILPLLAAPWLPTALLCSAPGQTWGGTGPLLHVLTPFLSHSWEAAVGARLHKRAGVGKCLGPASWHLKGENLAF